LRATTKPQTTSEITEAATNAKTVRFFSFSSLKPETTKKNPLFRNSDRLVMRTFAPMCKGLAQFVTNQYRRLGWLLSIAASPSRTWRMISTVRWQ
jgi:hypothetical protein